MSVAYLIYNVIKLRYATRDSESARLTQEKAVESRFW